MVSQLLIVVSCYILFILQMIVIRTVIGEVQLTVSIHEGEVTITIESAFVLATNLYKVFVIQIHHRCCNVSKYRYRIGIYDIATRAYVTTSKDGITDGDSLLVML